MKASKKIVVFLSLILLVSVSFACSSQSSDTAVENDISEEKEFTLEELKKYNGKDGEPAYVAVDGIVYDVSHLSKWEEGTHNGHTAGNDLTEEIKNDSPHGLSVLKKAKKVGILKEE